MKSNYFLRLFLFSFFSLLFIYSVSTAQNQSEKYVLLLKSGNIKTEENVDVYIQSSVIDENEVFSNRYYRIIQFHTIPNQKTKLEFEKLGIKLLDYIPNYAYFASISTQFNTNNFKELPIRSILKFKPEYKLSTALLNKDYPSWAITGEDKIDLIINYFPDLSSALITTAISKNIFIEILSKNDFSNQLTIRIPISKIEEISRLYYISYIESIDPPAEPENLVGRTSHRSNVIANDYASGRHYDGTGVNIAMGDDGIIGPHIDYQGRTDQANVSSNNGDHGDHVAGIIMGAGNLNPLAKGMAFGADLFVYSVWDAINFTPTTYYNPGIRITSLSYGNGCNAGYTSFARTADQQIRQMPSLMHVFSAGNSGTSDCGYGAGSYWGNITGGIKVGKNVIAVGNLDYIDGLATSSSRGPAHDGRIKPDVCAVGTSVFSTIDENTYDTKTGTSMACPGVTGTLAQLYHAYRELNGGIDPESGLLKAILMNSADDLGNPGPDFKFGFGRINALKAVKTLEDVNYLTGTINQGDLISHSINVPVGTQEVKIMVYWTDYEATSNASIALVNDINMQVSDPSSSIFNPWVLDHTPNSNSLNLPATRGVDNLNNMEQVTIESPLSGAYSITLNGFQIPQGPQTYFVVYEFVNEDITITYPNGGESFVPGVAETLRWDAFGNSGNFTLEYSIDNGTTWNLISSSINSGTRYYTWAPPSLVSGQALIKVSRGLSIAMSDYPFSLIGVPQNLMVDWACPDSIQLSWNAVTGATSYEASILGNKFMDSTGTTNTNSIILYIADPLIDQWYSVKAKGATNAIGRRAIAIKKNSGIWDCPIPYDVQLTSIENPSGKLQNCQDHSNTKLSVNLKNIGLSSISNIPLNYSINGGSTVSEIFNGTIPSGDSITYIFSATADFSSTGSYSISAWTAHVSDDNNYNDTSSTSVQLSSGTTVSIPWFEDFENFTLCSTSNTCEAISCNLSNGWVNHVNNLHDNIDWRTNKANTPSTGTGPTVDNTLQTSEGKYLYMEATDCFNKMGMVETPCINIGSIGDAQLSFWFYMYGAPSMGELHVDILTDGIWTNDAIPAKAGNYGNQWIEEMVDLSAYVGKTINIRFRGTTGLNDRSDIAIDDIAIQSTVSIAEQITSNKKVIVYPNPSNGRFNLNIKNSQENSVEITVTDLSGRKVYSRNIPKINSNFTTEIDLSDFSTGIYYLQLISGENIFHKKLSLL
ncbi:MAG: S8 family serine peptidase [Bacteroidota bacterium]|nr:S8 family serine peptidase [Bacteroidota bacterium]